MYPNNYLSNFYFTKIDGENGLSQNNIKSILQHSSGFMWFGSRNKLNRYDGTSIKVYDCYDPIKQKRDNNISALYEDGEKNIWIGSDKGVFIFDPVMDTFSFLDDRTDQDMSMNDWIADIRGDLDNNVWIVIPNQGLFRYNNISKKLFYYEIGSTALPDQGNPQCICIEQSGRVWIGTNGGGIYLYDKSTDSFTQFLGNKNNETLEEENIYTMCDIGEYLIVGIHEEKLLKFNKRKNSITAVNAPEVHYKIIRHVTYIDGEIWVATDAGLYVINELKNTVVHIHEDPMHSFALSDNLTEKIYQDKEGGIWIATHFGGVNYLPNRSIEFKRHTPVRWNNSIGSKRIRELREDKNGNIWIATEDAGVNIFNPKTEKYTMVGKDTRYPLHYNKILSLLLDDNKVWVGLFKNGLDIIQLPQLAVQHYSGEDLGLNESSIYAICEDRNGKIWIGNAWGVYSSSKKDMKFKNEEQFELNFIYDIIEDTDCDIWVATMGRGVYRYNPESGKTDHFVNNIDDPTSLSSNSVSNITQTSTGVIWFSTDRGGICRYNKDKNNFTAYSVKDGLPDDVAYKILEDKNKYLWFGTNKGLVKFHPESKVVKVFTTNDGLSSNQFNYKSALASSDNKFYFGGLNGMIEVDPYRYTENKFVPPVYITKLTIFNEEININTPDSPLKKSIVYTNNIVLNYNQSNISLDFVALSYTAPSVNKYAYMMENIDKNWIYADNNHTVSYANLPPGEYVFRVKGCNNDGFWNEEGTSINIRVLPPWWSSKPAYIIYLSGLLFITFCMVRRYIRRNEKRNAEKQWIYETEKEKEVYTSKLDFYTNIAHEIRTPITLINGPLESMMEMDIKDPDIKKNLKIMSRNTSELLNLINQLLDFRKADSNKFLMSFAEVSISKILKDFYAKFETLAVKEKKKIRLNLPPKEIIAPIDRNGFTKILNNLFSNAIRYSESYIEIQLDSDDKYFIIKMDNDGNLVPEELKEKIFDPFYQLSNKNEASSSGIGLSLARSLAELHKGSLIFSETDGLNSFILKIPLIQEKTEKKILQNDDYIIEDSDNKHEKLNAEIILIAEDNKEMLNFIADRLKEQFIVEKALNGKEAMKILEEKNIDLVLTDIMMPEMDGFELCKNIKTNLEYSHIPVVLLTAKNDFKSKIHGLEMGADAYIEKPFSFNYLLTQLMTLLGNRQREKEAFIRKPFLPIQQMGMTKADEEFMAKIVGIIEDNITDTNFNVERLSEIVYMSRSTLHRKIKALTDTPPTDFIRLIRLRKSVEYIASGEYRIGEVCYLVGINSPSYFIKLFQKQFGMTPKEFEKQQLQNRNKNKTNTENHEKDDKNYF
ncbi:two-component regulator propeller domain-containing protein [Prevotella sp. 10(H)]|uniref:hybrid sensor histidine kinase/response regulator transcription factor n=1 Tax=Prevotella sp. 10(H) TaxID=1158294 RepID=UPI00350FF1B9